VKKSNRLKIQNRLGTRVRARTSRLEEEAGRVWMGLIARETASLFVFQFLSLCNSISLTNNKPPDPFPIKIRFCVIEKLTAVYCCNYNQERCSCVAEDCD